MRKAGIFGLIVVMAATFAVVGMSGEAGADTNPIEGTSRCMYTDFGTPPVCTFTGTVNGVPYTGTLDAAYITTSIVGRCSPGDPRIAYSDGYYSLNGGTGVFAGVTGYGRYSETASAPSGFPKLTDTLEYGSNAGHCGIPIQLPQQISYPVIGGQPLPDATLGQPYGVPLLASGGTPPYRFSRFNQIGKLPPGLKVDKATGTIYGLPKNKKRTGTFTFGIRIKDSGRPRLSSATTFQITVNPPG